jgi:hypothetical protein
MTRKQPDVTDVWQAVSKVPAGRGLRTLAEIEAEKERARVEQERRDRRNARRRYRRATRKADSTAPPQVQAVREDVQDEPLLPARPVDPRIARAAARDAAWAAEQRRSSSVPPGMEGLAEWLAAPRRRSS